MKRLISILTPLSVLMMVGCSHWTTTDVVTVPTVKSSARKEPAEPRKRDSRPVMALRPVIVYKMSGDYADLVPVTLDSKGTIVSYPDPVDVTESCRPVALGDGWYLDHRGVSASSAFTDYTYAQYHALDHVPPIDTLQAHIVARNAIVAIWDCGRQERSIAELQQLVKDGFPGCKKVFGALVFTAP